MVFHQSLVVWLTILRSWKQSYGHMFVNLKTAQIFFDVVGSKLATNGECVRENPTLIALHGGPGSDQISLRPYFDRLGDAMQVVYIDHRACGRSSGAIETCNLDQWAQDLFDLIGELGIERPMIFGQSFGGMVAMRFATLHPGICSKLVLSSTAAKFPLRSTIATFHERGGEEPAKIAEAFFSQPTLVTYQKYEEICLPLYTRVEREGRAPRRSKSIQSPEVTVHFFQNEMMKMDLRHDLHVVECPVLVLAGSIDPITPVSCSEEIARAIGENARLVVMPNCGHGVHRDEPDKTEHLLRGFLLA